MVTDVFERPTRYWLNRARSLWQAGRPLKAAVLERNALRADPDSDAACLSYAYTLRRLGCYEASNRTAFAALARRPERTALYGIIGQNMLDLGFREEGYDAMDVYLADPPDIPPEWQDEAYDMLDEADHHLPPALAGPRRYARFETLLRIAARRAAMGDLPSAGRALARSRAPVFFGPDQERDLIEARYWALKGKAESCEESLRRAIRRDGRSAKVRVMAAASLWELGKRARARAELLRAAVFARTPADRQVVCRLSDAMGQPSIALVMLKRFYRETPYRFPVCFDLCACLARLGRLEEAARLANLCREIDPDDVQGQWLFAGVTALRERPGEVLPPAYYGSFTDENLQALLAPLAQRLAEGTLARGVREDEALRQRLMFLLSLPLDAGAYLLSAIEPEWPREAFCALLRETLLCQPLRTQAKDYALSRLQALGAKPPYTVWQDGRFLRLDPTRLPMPEPTAFQRVLAMRARQAGRLCPRGGGVIVWTIRLAGRMNAAQRRELLFDPLRVWPTALATVYRAREGLTPLRLRLEMDPARTQALLRAVHTLEILDGRNQA